MNNMFNQLVKFEKNYSKSSFVDRIKNDQKVENKEELREVVGEVQKIEGAMLKCVEIAKFAMEKYDDVVGKHQHMMIEYDSMKT